MSCDNKKNRKAQNEDDVNKAKASLDNATAALAKFTKQEAEEEKKHVDAEAEFITVVISIAASGPVSRCHTPIAAVARYGLFRMLLGTPGTLVLDVAQKVGWNETVEAEKLANPLSGAHRAAYVFPDDPAPIDSRPFMQFAKKNDPRWTAGASGGKAGASGTKDDPLVWGGVQG